MTVTQLRPRRHRLTAVYLDGGETPVLLDTETLLQVGLQVGDTLNEEEWVALQNRCRRSRAYEKALYLLEYRAHSRAELLQKIRREYPAEAAAEAVERVAALGLLDDEAYARDYARELFETKRYGARRVALELRRRGIDGDIIQRVLDEQTSDPVVELVDLIRKRWPVLPADRRKLAKLSASLVRRGYEYDQVRQALRQLIQTEFEDECE